MTIKEIALDLTVFTLSNVNDAISFKPQLCFEVPRQEYQTLRDNYISFTGTSIRKNRPRLFFLPTNVSDELQKLNPSIPDDAKRVPSDGRIYYKNRLITELDYENVRRVETACAFIAYTALNSFAHFETDSPRARDGADEPEDYEDEVSAAESVGRALRKGNILGFRELGHLVGITPWHFHRVFKVITGLTIREYGQLCVEFIKKNKEIVNTCRVKVEQLRRQQHFSCLDDPNFLQDGSLQYAATENVVLLHEYFIDPNKSKEFKTRKNGGAKPSRKEADDEAPPPAQRSEIRKRRSSVMYGRMQRASQTPITSNSSLYECLQNSDSRTDLRSQDCYLSNEDLHSDNDSDDSTCSRFNLFPVSMPKSVSPPVTSRRGSIISIGSAGGVSKKNGKRKSITAVNIDAIQSSLLPRRNRSDGCSINISFEPRQTETSLDARMSPPPVPQQGSQLPIEFNSNVFDLKSANKVDFSIGPLDYNMVGENLFKSAAKPSAPAPSMTDMSLFNNSLLEQTTPAEASALNLALDNMPERTNTTVSGSYAVDRDLIADSSAPPMEDILEPASLVDTSIMNNHVADISNLTPLSEDVPKTLDLDYDSFFNAIPADDAQLFEAGITAGDAGLVVGNSVTNPQH